MKRPKIRLLFDENLPQTVAQALRVLRFNTSYVGNDADGQPAQGTGDGVVLAHARKTSQVMVTSNLDMVLLCAEEEESVIWIDPRGRQFRREELAGLAFHRIREWERLLAESSEPVCVRALRTKSQVLSLERAAHLARRRLKDLELRQRKKRERELGTLLDGGTP